MGKKDENEISDSESYYLNYFKDQPSNADYSLRNQGNLGARAILAKFGRDYDYYHLNIIKVLPDTALGRKDKRFQQGNCLFCLRNADLILILNKDTKDIVWSFGPGVLD